MEKALFCLPLFPFFSLLGARAGKFQRSHFERGQWPKILVDFRFTSPLAVEGDLLPLGRKMFVVAAAVAAVAAEAEVEKLFLGKQFGRPAK